MSVKQRVWYPGVVYHITARGNRRNDIFKDEEDFIVYIDLIKNSLQYYKDKFQLICFCLMDNHIHLMIETTDMHIKYLIGRINSIYAKYFNKKHNYIGHLYQDRYFTEPIESDSQILETSRYIHMNPVRANMVQKPENYKWSSYKYYVGIEEENLIQSDKILDYFNENNKYEAYKQFVESVIREKEV